MLSGKLLDLPLSDMPQPCIPTPGSPGLKPPLRAQMRAHRRALDAASRAALDEAIQAAVLEFVRSHSLTLIAAYSAFDGEPDLAPALRQLRTQGLRLFLPVLRELDGRRAMEFRHWNGSGPLSPNRFGIAEPETGETLRPEALDLVLLPLVAWDSAGNRLGMGAGYYDRALAAVAAAARPLRIGVAYEAQRVEHVPCGPHDVRLHGVITERGWTACGPAASDPPPGATG